MPACWLGSRQRLIDIVAPTRAMDQNRNLIDIQIHRLLRLRTLIEHLTFAFLIRDRVYYHFIRESD